MLDYGMKRKQMYIWWGIVVCLLAFLAMGMYVAHWEFRKPLLEVYFFHLNRGRSIFIRTPHNQTILIDGGQNSDILREITKVLPFYRRRIDIVVLTNSAPKNAGGLGEVVKRYDIGKILKPTIMGTSTALAAFEKSVQEKGLPIEKVQKGGKFMIDGINFNILFPDASFKFNKTSLPEMVVFLSYASTSMLFLGDASKTIQKSFVSEIGKVNIIEFAHSAGDARVSAELFEKSNPDFLVITKKKRQTARRQRQKRSLILKRWIQIE